MRIAPAFALAAVSCYVIAGCQGSTTDMSPTEMQPAEPSGIVNVTAVGLTFEAPDSIPSGWTTFRFKNTADVTHFAVMEHVPDGIGIAEHQEQAAPVFQRGMDLLNAGLPDSAFAEFGKLPEWFGKTVFTGGPGLTAPKHTSQTTVYLDPGTYILECYVKTDGNFHSYNANPGEYGMVHQFTVTRDSSHAVPPVPDISLTLSSTRGIEVEGKATPGRHAVAVHFADQTVHENFVGHDVHLVRLADDTDLDSLAIWMDWTQPTGLEDPPPAEFLGGAQEMPAGSTEYFTVTFEPGRYAWISEVTKPADKGMFKTFTVEATGS